MKLKNKPEDLLCTLCFIGDVHTTNISPKNRIDDYWETFKRKFEFIMSLDCDIFIQAGDLFNSFKCPKSVIAYMAETIKKDFCCVYGQHDMKYHSPNVEDTPLNILNKAGIVHVLNDVPWNLSNGIRLYGASFNEEIPEIKDENYFNILVTHRMVIKEKLWEGQKDFTHASELEKTDFDLILSGDNHQKFVQGKVVNPGSVMRSNVLQINHEPSIFIVKIFKNKKYLVKEVKISIEPWQKVFNEKNITKEVNKTKELTEFINKLDLNINDYGFSEESFWGIVNDLIKNENNYTIYDILEEIKNER